MTQTRFSVSRFDADNTPQPEGLRCVSVFVPDDDKFVVLLAGLVGLTTRATNWEGVQSNREILAQLCLAGFVETDWSGCMDCGDVQNCIETDEGVQGALTEQIVNNIENNTDVGQSIINFIQENNTTGTNMPETVSGGSMVPDGTFETDGDCDEDKVGTGCEYLSRYIDGMVSDFFELLASQTENAKIAAKAAGAIPVLGDYIQSAAEFAIALQEKIAVTYAGAQSEENILSIACDFKCRAGLTCSLSIDDAIDVIVTRLGTISPSEFGEIITLLITGTFAGVQIVETGYLVALAALKFGQAFGPNVGIRPIGQIMQIGAADSNAGWEEWCPDCPEDWEVDINLQTASDAAPGDVPIGTFVFGTGVVSVNTGGTGYVAQVHFSGMDWSSSTLSKVQFWANADVADGGAFRGMIYVTGGSVTLHDLGGGETGDYTLTDSSPESTPDDIYLDISNTAGTPGTNIFTRYRLTGTGPNPFGL